MKGFFIELRYIIREMVRPFGPKSGINKEYHKTTNPPSKKRRVISSICLMLAAIGLLIPFAYCEEKRSEEQSVITAESIENNARELMYEALRKIINIVP